MKHVVARAVCVMAFGSLGACGTATPRATLPVAPADPAAAAVAVAPDPADEEEDDDNGYALDRESTAYDGSFTAPGAHERVVVRTYSGPGSSPSQEAEEQGFVTTPRYAELVLLNDAGEELHTWTVSEWEDGWEWGSSVQLEGTLELGATGRLGVVLRYSSHGEGPGIESRSDKIDIAELGPDGGRNELWSVLANEITVSIQGGRMALTLSGSKGFDDDGEQIETVSMTVGYFQGAIIELGDD